MVADSSFLDSIGGIAKKVGLVAAALTPEGRSRIYEGEAHDRRLRDQENVQLQQAVIQAVTADPTRLQAPEVQSVINQAFPNTHEALQHILGMMTQSPAARFQRSAGGTLTAPVQDTEVGPPRPATDQEVYARGQRDPLLAESAGVKGFAKAAALLRPTADKPKEYQGLVNRLGELSRGAAPQTPDEAQLLHDRLRKLTQSPVTNVNASFNMSPGERTQFSDLDTALESLDSVDSLYGTAVKSGKAGGILAGGSTKIADYFDKAGSTRELLVEMENLKKNLLTAKEGKRLSDKDYERAQKFALDIQQDPTTFQANVRALRNLLRRTRGNLSRVEKATGARKVPAPGTSGTSDVYEQLLNEARRRLPGEQ